MIRIRKQHDQSTEHDQSTKRGGSEHERSMISARTKLDQSTTTAVLEIDHSRIIAQSTIKAKEYDQRPLVTWEPWFEHRSR
jgi:hypothetical protein